jgi:hypothetical protein
VLTHAFPQRVNPGPQCAPPPLPQTFGIPPPPQVWGGVQAPQWSVPPQPSGIGPQLAPACAHVVGVHPPHALPPGKVRQVPLQQSAPVWHGWPAALHVLPPQTPG